MQKKKFLSKQSLSKGEQNKKNHAEIKIFGTSVAK